MSVVNIERKRITVSLPIVAYNSLEELSKKEEMSVHQYCRHLVEQEIIKNNLPLYWQVEKSND